MTPEQKSTFEREGVLLLRGAIDKRVVAPMRTFILDELKRLKIWASGKTLSASMKALPAFQQIASLSNIIKRDDLGVRLMTEHVLSEIYDAAGANIPPAYGQLLISLPNQGEWTLKNLNWHTDIARSVVRRIPGVQVFVLIDDVKPHGGATLALAGSHRLDDGGNRRLRELLRKSEDLERDLVGEGLSIVEMSGQAGDVYITDMRTLHTPSINATKHVRMMATFRYVADR